MRDTERDTGSVASEYLSRIAPLETRIRRALRPPGANRLAPARSPVVLLQKLPDIR